MAMYGWMPTGVRHNEIEALIQGTRRSMDLDKDYFDYVQIISKIEVVCPGEMQEIILSNEQLQFSFL